MWKEYYVAALLFLNGVWDWKKERGVPSKYSGLAGSRTCGGLLVSGTVDTGSGGRPGNRRRDDGFGLSYEGRCRTGGRVASVRYRRAAWDGRKF